MAVQEFVFAPNAMLKPLFESGYSRLVPVRLAAGTYAQGVSLGRNLSTGLFGPYGTGNTDGTGVWAGFNQIACSVDASGNHFLQTGTGAGAANYFSAPQQHVNMYEGGIFSPNDVLTSGTSAAEVDTFTPGGTITVGDVYTLTTVNDGRAFSVSYTATAATVANVAAGLLAAWQASAAASNVATASGGTTNVVLTNNTANAVLNVTSSVVGTGTLARAVTTARGGFALSDVQTGAPGAHLDQQSGAIIVP